MCDDCKCVCACSLTIKPNVMVGEDCGTVALSNSPHGNMQHAVGCLHIVLLHNTDNTNKHLPTPTTNTPTVGLMAYLFT